MLAGDRGSFLRRSRDRALSFLRCGARRREYLYCGEHDVGLAGDSDDDRSLLDGFLCVLYLKDATLWRAEHSRQHCG